MPWKSETEPKTALAILAGINEWESKKKVGQPTGQKETSSPVMEEEVVSDYVDPSFLDEDDFD